MKNYKVKIDDSGATPTASVKERTFGQACGDAVTTLISDKEASVGYAKTLVHAGLLYGGMVLTNRQLTGSLNWNPFAQ